MDYRTKSDIMKEIGESLDAKTNKFIECVLKKTNLVVQINTKFEERISFIDENGVKWIKE